MNLLKSRIFIVIFSVALLGVMSLDVETAYADKNYTTKVTVYTKNGNPAKGRKVSLEFVGGFLGGGFTDNEYTNSDGEASIKHASKGKVKVYVDGNGSSHETTGKAPGEIFVYLKG
ncbi:MAG: hypothetical protein HQM12_22460 [SAR324 cluster bacterium]|nr:hypothetical protein [SAR324 cluster bacterium]